MWIHTKTVVRLLLNSVSLTATSLWVVFSAGHQMHAIAITIPSVCLSHPRQNGLKYRNAVCFMPSFVVIGLGGHPKRMCISPLAAKFWPIIFNSLSRRHCKIQCKLVLFIITKSYILQVYWCQKRWLNDLERRYGPLLLFALALRRSYKSGHLCLYVGGRRHLR